MLLESRLERLEKNTGVAVNKKMFLHEYTKSKYLIVCGYELL